MAQRRFQYNPHDEVDTPEQFGIKMKTTHIKGFHGHDLWTWYREPDEGMATIIYIHGRSCAQGFRTKRFKTLINEGFGVVCATHRYNSSSGGTPSEKGMVCDSRAVLKWVEKTLKIPKSQTILYGESLGCGVASKLASKDAEYKGLILEVPFTSMVDMAKLTMWIFPIFTKFVSDKFNNKRNIKKVHIPVLIGGAEFDETIPVRHSYIIFENANEPKKYIIGFGSDHMGMYEQKAWIKAVFEFCKSKYD